MKTLNLIILIQQLENYKNFQYNNHMKNKEEKIAKLAKEIIELEKIISKGQLEDKNVQSAMHRIEYIMERLTIKEGLELNDTVIRLLKN